MFTTFKKIVAKKKETIMKKNEHVEYFDSLKSAEKGIDIAGMLTFKN